MDKKRIINLTQHYATKDQIVAGVIDLPEDLREELVRRLTFDELPGQGEAQQRAACLAGDLTEWLASADIVGIDTVMIGGAPYLMCPLERYLTDEGYTPVYAYSQRETYEEKQDDGSVRKIAVFRHGGFVQGAYNQGW